MTKRECPDCGKSYVTSDSYKKHLEKCDGSGREKFLGYYCDSCGRRLRDGKDFSRHLQVRHGVTITGEGSDGRLGREPGTVEIVRDAYNGSAYRVSYRRDV